MNVSFYYTKVYKNESASGSRTNKPNSNPIKPNFLKAQMNVNLFRTKDYENISDWTLIENKPNSKPIFSKDKMNASFFATKDYENKTAFGRGKNKPKQTQWIGNQLKSPIFPKLTKCPIYRRFAIDVDNENR